MLRKRIYSAIESALCNRTAHTYDSINVSQSSRNPPRPRLVIEEILKTVHRRLAGQSLIYVGSVEFAICSWEGRPPCRPVPMRGSLTGLSAIGDS